MAEAREIEQKSAVRCARYLKAIADPIRLRMIRAGQSGPTNAGLVVTEREGKFIYYSLSAEVMQGRAAPSGLFDFGCCKLDLRVP